MNFDGELFRKLVRKVDDWPKAGITFLDLNPYLADPKGFQEVRHLLLAQALRVLDHGGLNMVGTRPTIIAGLESRGLGLAGYLAAELKCGFLSVRKRQTPPPTQTIHSTKEYGQDELEIPKLDLNGWNILIVDDIVATGGTLQAAHELFKICGARVSGAVAITNVPGLQPEFDFPIRYAIVQ